LARRDGDRGRHADGGTRPLEGLIPNPQPIPNP
jgi:hypothetical protein